MKIVERIAHIPPVVARLVGVVVILIVGTVDEVAGPAISFALFYLLPIAFVTWYGGLPYAFLCSILSTGMALWADVSWWPSLPFPAQLWNAVARLANFAAVAVLLDYIHKFHHSRLKQVEDKYTRVVESIVEGIIAVDVEGKIRFANSRAANIVGSNESSMIGHRVSDFIVEDSSLESMRELLLNQKQTLGPVEIQFVHPDGALVWALVNSNASQDEDGAIDGVVLLVTDISELKRGESALRESEQNYRTLVERMNEGLLRVDSEDRIQFVNEAFCEIVGYSKQELVGRIASELLLAPDDRHLISEKYALRRQGIADMYEVQIRRKSGDCIWTRVSGAPVTDANGIVVGSIGVHTDITLQKIADEELRRRYDEISAMQRLSSVLAQSVHLHRRLESALDTVLDVLKYDGGTIFMFEEGGKELVLRHQRGLSDEVVERTHRWPAGKGMIGRVALTGVSGFVEDARNASEIDATIREMTSMIAVGDVPLESKGKVLGVMTVFLRRQHVFTENERLMLQAFGKQIGIALENAQLYETGHERERQIRRLSIELVKVQEDERKRFARELHDGLSQVLTTLKISAELAAKNFTSDPDEAERHLREALNLADEAQVEAKELAYDLRPAILDDFGLKAAIDVLVSSFERRTGISAQFIAQLPGVRFDSLLETSVYRIVQELLTNVAKHAGATRISIQLLLRENMLVLDVTDDGKGFEAVKGQATAQQTMHFGLRNIRERVEFFGGSFRTESLAGHGTEVMIEVPVGSLMLQPQKHTVGG